MDLEAIAGRLKYVLATLNYTQSSLASRAAIPQPTISKIVHCKIVAAWSLEENAQKIADATGIRADWLLYGAPPMMAVDYSRDDNMTAILEYLPNCTDSTLHAIRCLIGAK